MPCARCLQTFTQLHLLLRLDNNSSGMFYYVANVNYEMQQLTIKHIQLRLSKPCYQLFERILFQSRQDISK